MTSDPMGVYTASIGHDQRSNWGYRQHQQVMISCPMRVYTAPIGHDQWSNGSPHSTKIKLPVP
uniref:Uncharacterized protein n=1 Tax=Anguilla anguilla TaxID=7936 RepID=A0A0E9WBP7_ANGAN